MTTHSERDFDTSGLDSALRDLVASQLGFGKELVKVIGAGSGKLLGWAGGLRLPAGSSCCDIPQPCWMPKSLGEVCCTLGIGEEGELCLDIVNEDFKQKSYVITAEGADADLAAIAAADKNLTLGSKERRTVSVRVKMPATEERKDREESCCDSDSLELLIWVRGCNSHYVRWTLHRGERDAGKCCHRVCVVDTPDYELHWYDHFHFPRPCGNQITTA